ncbi:MAG TPA: DUF167 domain-containing protein [Acidimicrobiales bacterium]|nr:DUF167 domain-containing protein [Acidimicrobiales bacterium]
MTARDLFRPDGDDAVVLAVHAQPGAGRTQVVGRHGDALKVRVAAPPEQGRANDALVGVLADRFGVPASAVTLTQGATSRAKRFRIAGLAADEFAERLEKVLVDDGPPGRQAPKR